jgi:hypothetical protein
VNEIKEEVDFDHRAAYFRQVSEVKLMFGDGFMLTLTLDALWLVCQNGPFGDGYWKRVLNQYRIICCRFGFLYYFSLICVCVCVFYS